jgi:hypothetical protein
MKRYAANYGKVYHKIRIHERILTHRAAFLRETSGMRRMLSIAEAADIMGRDMGFAYRTKKQRGEQMNKKNIRIAGFTGSLRQGSYNKAALRAAGELMPDGSELEIVDLADLPFLNEDVEAAGVPV